MSNKNKKGFTMLKSRKKSSFKPEEFPINFLIFLNFLFLFSYFMLMPNITLSKILLPS